MKVGDLIWYNCAGSKHTGIILEMRTMKDFGTYGDPCEMMKVHWNARGSGPRPAMYDGDGQRLWGAGIRESYVRTKSKEGFYFFKVISEA